MLWENKKKSCIRGKNCILTQKAPIMTAADDSLEYFFSLFSEKIRLGRGFI